MTTVASSAVATAFGSFIPKPDIAGPGVGNRAMPADSVRSQVCYGHSRHAALEKVDRDVLARGGKFFGL
jgi:hypothetical protein